MQISQWTTEIIVISVIIAVACCVIGYFVAALRHGNRLGQLTSQLGQAQQAQGGDGQDLVHRRHHPQ